MREEQVLNVNSVLNESQSGECPMISCVVPAYNVSGYIERCIDSLMKQSYSKYEIIIVNDGSTDNTGKIIQKYLKSDKVKIINQHNQGLSAARNTGIANAVGEYITFVDSDDWVDLDFLKVMALSAVKFNADIVSVMNDECVQDKGDVPHESDELVYNDHLCADVLFSLIDTNFAWGKLFRRKLIDVDFFPVGRTYEDIGSMYKAYDICDRHVKIYGCYYHYFLRQGSITSTRKINHVIDKLFFINEMQKYRKRMVYEYWDFYVLVKCFGAMADLYKIKNLPKDELKKYRTELYSCTGKMKLKFRIKREMDISNWFRALLIKMHLAHLVMKIKTLK